MTRETKIGLLVGLAFIIVIGILLSDHLTSATEPQGAQLAQVAGNVRNGVAVPGAAVAQPPITQVQPPVTVAPAQRVPTKEEITPKQPPVEIVHVGGPAEAPRPASQSDVAIKPPAHNATAHNAAASHAAANTPSAPAAPPVAGNTNPPTAPPAHEPPITLVDNTNTAPPAPPTPVKAVDPSKSALAKVAETFNEELVPVGQQPTAAQPTKIAVGAAALPPGARQYKAQTGDTLSRLASRFLGSDTKANRDAILAVNPTLQKNPDVIVLGRTYVIPAAGAGALATPAPIAPVAPAQTQTLPLATIQVPPPIVPPVTPDAPPAGPAAPVPGESFYVVKAGDSLTKIAVEQLGSPDAVPAIVDLNKDVLKGRDIIRPNMKLRMPARPLAMAM